MGVVLKLDERTLWVKDREVMEGEIEVVINSMPLDKAPGPDGITVEFYIKCWPTVKSDFVAAVKYHFSLQHL